MKQKITILLLLMLTGTWAQAQFSHLSEVKFESSEMYAEFAEQVLDCSYYLLMTPYNKKDDARVAASKFIIRWMKSNPSVNFKVSDNIKALTQEKDALIELYTSCYARHFLENKDKPLSQDELEKKALHSLIEYCNKPNNKVKPTKEIKEMALLTR